MDDGKSEFQVDMFNTPEEIVGAKYFVHKITPQLGKKIIIKYHYSGKAVNNSLLYLGVFNKSGDLVGCLQYGYCMNDESTSNKFTDKKCLMFELNRMVMADDEPRNSESQAISLCNKWLRTFTDVEFILSFSDGKEGNVGYIYQATNWRYIGYMISDSFYDLDGVVNHSVTVWHKYKEKHPLRDTHTTHEILFTEFENVSILTCKQHIYLFAIKKRTKFIHGAVEYPKKDKEKELLSIRVLKKDGIILEPPVIENFYTGTLTDVFGKKISANNAPPKRGQ